MKCELTDRDQRMDDFLMGRLSPTESEAYEIHLFGCSECLQEVRLREQTIKLIKQERETLIADYNEQKSPKQRGALAVFFGNLLEERPRAWVYAGLAVALVLAALLARQFSLKKDFVDPYAANFDESPRLESVMRQTYQSSAVAVLILSPKLGEKFQGDILFEWNLKKEGMDFKGPVDLKIINNKEQPIFTKTIEGKTYRLRESLVPGLYYWTLEDQGEMLYLGKFFISKPAP